MHNSTRQITRRSRMLSVQTLLLTVAVLASGMSASRAFAQASPAQTSPAQTPPASASAAPQYLIAPGDTIDVSVINFTDLSTTAIVPSDGKITFPVIGTVSVVGRTTGELSTGLAAQFNKYVVDPIVNVTLTAKHKQSVTVGGAVAHPGLIDYIEGMRSLTAISQAGGGLPTSDLTGITVTHLSGGKETINLTKPALSAGSSSDIVLQEGDSIYVPDSTKEISIVGEVKSPGSYPYHDEMTVLDAIGLAGGVTDAADLRHASLSGTDPAQSLNLDGALKHGDLTSNVKLHPGDTITVPLIARTYVFGAVNKPGYYPYNPGDRVVDALNGAGGPEDQADIGRIKVIRISADKSTAVSQQVDLNKFFKDADLRADVPLNPGDVLFVPNRRHGFSWDTVFSALQGVNLLNVGAHIATHGLGY